MIFDVAENSCTWFLVLATPRTTGAIGFSFKRGYYSPVNEQFNKHLSFLCGFPIKVWITWNYQPSILPGTPCKIAWTLQMGKCKTLLVFLAVVRESTLLPFVLSFRMLFKMKMNEIKKHSLKTTLGGGFKSLLFSPLNWGKWSTLTNIFSDGLVQPPTK